MKKINGFTLAEVLITLTIIGVIAALTIPNLMQKWSDHADVQKVKEAYSILSNAFKLSILKYGPIDDWNVVMEKSSENKNLIGERLAENLKVAKYCGSTNGCFPSSYKTLNGIEHGYSPNRYGGKMILANGMSVGICLGSMAYTIRVDINGLNGPNRYGYDVFNFGFDEQGLSNQNHLTYGGGHNSFYMDKTLCDFSGAKNSYYNHEVGDSCSTWVLKHGNMDYKYRDVSAEW